MSASSYQIGSRRGEGDYISQLHIGRQTDAEVAPRSEVPCLRLKRFLELNVMDSNVIVLMDSKVIVLVIVLMFERDLPLALE